MQRISPLVTRAIGTLKQIVLPVTIVFIQPAGYAQVTDSATEGWKTLQNNNAIVRFHEGQWLMSQCGAFHCHSPNVCQTPETLRVLKRQCNPTQAIRQFKAALQLNPYTSLSASIHNSLGLAYLETHQYPEAITSFQRACRLQPEFLLYYSNLLKAYRMGGTLERVTQQMQAFIDENPEDAEAWLFLGLIAQEADKIEEAKIYFDKFQKLVPESELARVLLRKKL